MALYLRTAADRLALRASFIPSESRPILEHTNGSALYGYERGGQFYAISFWGTAARPFEHFRYTSEDKRSTAVLRFKNAVEAAVTRKATAKAQSHATPNPYKVGDIVNTSWGYDQTNVEFYAVTRATASTVWVRRVAADTESTGFMCGRTWPAMPLRFVGDETRHPVRGGSFGIKGHLASLTTGDVYESSYA